jgi:hypothetical protein
MCWSCDVPQFDPHIFMEATAVFNLEFFAFDLNMCMERIFLCLQNSLETIT